MSGTGNPFSDKAMLNSWQSSDKPTMKDFNDDNKAIETQVMWKKDYDPDGSIKNSGGIKNTVTLEMLKQIYPVGSIFFSMRNETPGNSLGFGTWTPVAAGRMLVGVNTNDADFKTVKTTGGSKHMRGHTHSTPCHTHKAGELKTKSTGAHTHMAARGQFYQFVGEGGEYHIQGAGSRNAVISAATANSGAHTHTVSGSTASGGSGKTGETGSGTQSANQANMPPYLVCYMWQRTA